MIKYPISSLCSAALLLAACGTNGFQEPDPVPAPSCNDAVQNQTETDVDCGGPCGPCPLGSGCSTPSECQSGNCEDSTCVPQPTGCQSQTRDGSETDVDCGGSCPACDPGKGCAQASDCVSGVCSPSNTCASPSCSDGVQNGDETGPDTGGSCEPPMTSFVRFIAIGDVGTGSATQIAVGQSIGTVCDSLGGCDFGVMLGDNFYQSGVDGPDDSLFETHFEIPYSHLGFPFFISLGNHDLGGDGLGVDLDFNKGAYQVQYSQQNPQWRMPAEHYRVEFGPVWLVSLNTTDVFFDQAGGQESDVASWMPEAGDRWKIAFGHHPYLSNGRHGNAGNYEGIPDLGSLSDIPRGKHVKDFMEDFVCGKFDVYLCGHDHNRQDLGSVCGTEFFVSGAGAKTTDLEGDNFVHFEADTEGFLLVEATDTTMTFYFYDETGALEHERSISK